MTKKHVAAHRLAVVVGAALLAPLVALPVVAAERLTDKDVKQLIERLHDERDRFEDQLDGKLKRSIIRGPGGEVKEDAKRLASLVRLAGPSRVKRRRSAWRRGSREAPVD